MQYLSESGITYLMVSSDECYQVKLFASLDKAMQVQVAELYMQLLESSINLLRSGSQVDGKRYFH